MTTVSASLRDSNNNPIKINNDSQSNSRLAAVRPEKLNLAGMHSTNYKWVECKILGKNIMIRSYSASTTYKDELYVHGGFQILSGTLSDFHKINVKNGVEKFQWLDVPAKSGVNPGARSKHAMVTIRNSIYLFGGLRSNGTVSNELYKYDTTTGAWSLVLPGGVPVPPLESFGCVVIDQLKSPKIVVICGYNGEMAEPVNSVYQYHVDQNKWSVLFAHTNSTKVPVGRSGCGCASDGSSKIYIFGGKAEDRLNDLWYFDLATNTYVKEKDEDELRPSIREGHSMILNDNKLFVFGGIHEVTWELDDLHIYDISKKHWAVLEVDSARKKDTHPKTEEKTSPIHSFSGIGAIENNSSFMQPQSISLKDCSRDAPSRASHKQRSNGSRWYDNPSIHSNFGYTTKHSSASHYDRSNQGGEASTDGNASPSKMRDEQRKKAFLARKTQLLKNFEVPESDKKEFLTVEPTSQAMKISLDVIGNPNPKLRNPGRITEFGKTTASKFMGPLVNNNNLIMGKRPCARDGHNSALIGGEIIIFGGDRHQMSFNDLYKLNLQMVRLEYDTHQRQ